MDKCNNFEKEVLEAKGFVLTDFYADWCGPCRLLIPVLEELSREFTDIKFLTVNVDNNQKLASSYNVNSIPHLILFKDGKKINSKIGGDTKNNIKDWLEESINI